MLNRVITVDFSKKCGRIKPLNCINGAPRSGGYSLCMDSAGEFSEMGIPMIRLAPASGEYGLNQFVNIHCIFPDFDADESLEESYNFIPTDQLVVSAKATGAEIIYRLGESSEPYQRRIYAKCPTDKEKWARICEHIVMHYNEGWANGFKYNIKHWEIWSGADSSSSFTDGFDEFYELYRITANHLRARFPRIKIGGYGASGFYALNRIDSGEELKAAIPFMQKFFAAVSREGTAAPFDFFTWCCYTSNPDELALHIKYARSYLDGAGLKRVKSIVCEYNTSQKRDTPPGISLPFPSELGASLILAQKNAVDTVIYSTSDPHSPDNGLFTVDDYVKPHRYAAFNAMRAFGRLYKLGTSYETGGDYRKELYALAAGDGESAAVMLVARDYSGKVEIYIKGSEFTACSVVKTVPGAERGEGRVFKAEDIAVVGSKLVLPVKSNEIFEITLHKAQK